MLCVIAIFSNCAYVLPFKDKKGITITDAFPNILDQSSRKPNKIKVDIGCKIYNRSMKSWLQDTGIEVYSTQNKRKSVVAERFIRFLKNKVNKFMGPISKNVYIYKLDDIANKFNNTYHRKIKVKSIKVKSNIYIDYIHILKKMKKIQTLKLTMM